MKRKIFFKKSKSFFVFKLFLFLISNNSIFSMQENRPANDNRKGITEIKRTELILAPKNLVDLAAFQVAKKSAQIYDQEGYVEFEKYIKKLLDDNKIDVFYFLINELDRSDIFINQIKDTSCDHSIFQDLFESDDKELYFQQFLDILSKKETCKVVNLNTEKFEDTNDLFNEAFLNEKTLHQMMLYEKSKSKSKTNFSCAECDFSIFPNEIIDKILFFLIQDYWKNIVRPYVDFCENTYYGKNVLLWKLQNFLKEKSIVNTRCVSRQCNALVLYNIKPRISDLVSNNSTFFKNHFFRDSK